jgi:hypothetical protein
VDGGGTRLGGAFSAEQVINEEGDLIEEGVYVYTYIFIFIYICIYLSTWI